ncbi:MAG: AAA family ATPase, partial [Chloroflexi bacterium]|nr:AAA family ATPase [Chloroflexota bacterium]
MTLRHVVPQPILEHYERGETRGTFQAATMFIDLSGFSSLSDELIQYGREGTEVLTDIINRTFDPIIHRVYEHGGFISTFAGDAFTAIFPLDRPDAIAHAIVAGFDIQDIMAAQRHLYTRLGTFSLAVKIGLDVGPVYWGILGRGDAHTYYYRGPAIDGAAHAEAHARAGHIIASARLWPHIQDHVHGRPVSDARDAYRILSHTFTVSPTPVHLSPLTEDQLRPFVPESILHLSIPAEFRNLCSTFISFQEPDTPDALDEFVTHVMALADIYGGYFNKIDFGDKGNVILLLFGAPISHENNVARAAEFLLALRDQERDIPWRAGVTFGTAYAGIVGGRARCEYTAIGDVVNLSSRLMTLADWGHILTDARVHRQVRNGYRFIPLGRRTVKGKRKPVLVYRLVARAAHRAPVTERRPIFGRERELAQLEAWITPLWADPGDGTRPVFVHITGDAGMGKTRLLQEVRARLEDTHPLQWLYCPADDILRQSLNPFAHALKQYFHQSADRSPEENRATFHRILESVIRRIPSGEPGDSVRAELERTASLLAAILDIHWPGSLYEQLEPQLRFENTLLALTNFIKALALARPLILEVDGGHLLDGDSRTLLVRLMGELAGWPVAVLVASRGATDLPGGDAVRWRELHLGPLDEEGVRAIAAAILGRDLTEDAGRFLLE